MAGIKIDGIKIDGIKIDGIKMGRIKIDRRIQKTKKLLSQALVELILEKGYENVTVQDILDRANVGRATFYTHYENKELLLLDGPRNLGHLLFDEKPSVKANPSQKMGFRSLFEHVGQNLPLAKAMLGRKAGGIVTDSFRGQIAAAISSHYKASYADRKQKMLLSYLSQATAAAVCSLVTSWVDDDLVLTVDEISGVCKQMVDGALK